MAALPFKRAANAQAALYKLVAEAAAIAEEVAIHLVVITIHDAAKRAVAFAGSGVATQPAMHTDGRRHLEVPLARVVAFEGGIREYSGRADLDQIAAELAF